MTPGTKGAAYRALALPGGGLAMIANDARESLRGQMAALGLPDTDGDLALFKVIVAEALGPHASGMLLDSLYGVDALEAVRRCAPACGRVLAVDVLKQERGGRLTSSLDEEALSARNLPTGLRALKFLILWRPHESVMARMALAARFVTACSELGMLSILECIVDLPADDERFDDALVTAAAEFAPLEPDIYKTQVPSFGIGEAAEIERRSRRLTATIGCPWVVLSNGVPRHLFVSAVAAACRGGASGFLAGRGVWAPALATRDPRQELEARGVERLRELSSVVDAFARPWFVATGIDQDDAAEIAATVDSAPTT